MTKTVLITGASRGIGKAIAVEFANRGYNVIGTYLQAEEQVTELEKQLAGKVEVLFVKTDVCSKSDLQNLKEKALERFGAIDVLVNNAGAILRDAGWPDYDDESFEKSLRINVKGAIDLCREFTPVLKEQKGNIINITSTYGVLGGAPVLGYTTAKAALINATISLAAELAPDIRVNGVSPGNVDTDMTSGAPDEFIKATIESTPLKRLGKPQEVAKAVSFLASDEDASFITGHILNVDGGHILVN